jgi:integration host factor subunit alpha
MTKADIVERVYAKSALSRKVSHDMVESVFSMMKRTFESGENLKIHGFGCFHILAKKDRKGHNPMTGEIITISARRILAFKPSTILRQAINK